MLGLRASGWLAQACLYQWMMEPALPQRQRSSALCPEWPEVAKKAEGFLQVIRRARIVLTERGSGMR